MRENPSQSQNDLSKYYDDFYSSGDFRHFEQDLNYIKFLTSLFSDPPNSILLDIGCGKGYWSELFFRCGIGKVIGIDISLSGIRAACQEHPDCSFIVADARHLSFQKETFETIFCQGLSLFNTDELLKSREAGLEIVRCLKKNGHLIFATTTNLSGKSIHGWINHKKGDVQNFLISLGCKIEHSYLIDRLILLRVFKSLVFRDIFSNYIVPSICHLTKLPACLICVAKKIGEVDAVPGVTSSISIEIGSSTQQRI
ncbi:TPA: class I SAM-dependent methyltransferase [Candidatus Poribacteria bacterium]|nr:class I SAM-dependent methyltransferase [Candidatus Poribacteria bacterium]